MEIVINYYKEENVDIIDHNNVTTKVEEFTPIIPEQKTSNKEYVSKPCKNLEKLFSQKKRK